MRGYPDLAFELEEAVVAALRATSALVDGYLGSNAAAIRQGKTNREKLARSIAIQHADDNFLEMEAEVVLTFEFYAESIPTARLMRNLALAAVTSDYHFTLGSIRLWTQYQGTIREDDPEAGVAQMTTVVAFYPYRELETT